METLSLVTYRKIERIGLLDILNKWAKECDFEITEINNVESSLKRMIDFYNQLATDFNSGILPKYAPQAFNNIFGFYQLHLLGGDSPIMINEDPNCRIFGEKTEYGFVTKELLDERTVSSELKESLYFNKGVKGKHYMDIYVLYAICRFYDTTTHIFNKFHSSTKRLDYFHDPFKVNANAYIDMKTYASIEEHIDDFLENKKAHKSESTKYIEEKTVSSENSSEVKKIPTELDTPQAHELWNIAIAHGWVDYNLMPLHGQNKAAMMASIIADKLNLRPRWGAFESLWGINDLANKLSVAMTRKYYPDLIVKMENAFK